MLLLSAYLFLVKFIKRSVLISINQHSFHQNQITYKTCQRRQFVFRAEIARQLWNNTSWRMDGIAVKCYQPTSWSCSTCWARSENGSNTPETDQSPSIARGYFHCVAVYVNRHIFQIFELTTSSVAVSDASACNHDLPLFAISRVYEYRPV